MLIQIGKRRAPHHDLVENLLECHGRIRHFTELAGRLASTPDLPARDIRATAESIERYFRDSLPLHARDEEESILPRLRGQDPMLDEALERMSREHDEHQVIIAQLLDVVREVADEPSAWDWRRQQLSMLSRALEDEFGEHLASEEQIVFPAVASFLGAQDRAEIAREMAARRA